MPAVRSPKDFWTGVIYLTIGVGGYWIGREYPSGSAGRMGPGYFPTTIALLLLVFGVVAIVRSFLTPGSPIGGFAFKAMFLVLGGTLAFAFLINTAGLIVALFVLVLMSAAASEHFRFDWMATLGLVGLALFCSLVFVKGLGVPMPLVGQGMEPYVPSWLAR